MDPARGDRDKECFLVSKSGTESEGATHQRARDNHNTQRNDIPCNALVSRNITFFSVQSDVRSRQTAQGPLDSATISSETLVETLNISVDPTYNTIITKPSSDKNHLDIRARSAAIKTGVMLRKVQHNHPVAKLLRNSCRHQTEERTEGVATLLKGNTLRLEMNSKQESRRAFAC